MISFNRTDLQTCNGVFLPDEWSWMWIEPDKSSFKIITGLESNGETKFPAMVKTRRSNVLWWISQICWGGRDCCEQ